VCQLKRALYGLKQAPHTWNTRIDNYFTGLGFKKSEADANLYHIVVEDKLFIIVIYVDDLILIGDDELIKSCEEDIAREFEMKDMGLMINFLPWRYGRVMCSCLCLRAIMPTRYS